MIEQKNKAAKFTSYQIFVLILLALLQVTVMLDLMIISPIGDILMKTLNISTKQFSLIISSYAFSAAITGIATAGFSDRFDRKKILVLFYAGFTIGTICCGLANNYWQILTSRIVTGMFGGVITSIVFTIVADLFEVNLRGRAMSTVQMAFGISQIAGIPLGIYIANKLGWHYTFTLIAVLAAIIFVLILLKLKPITEHLKTQNNKKPILHLWHTIKNKNYQAGFLATMLLSMGGFMLMPFSTVFLVNNIHISYEQLPIIFLFTGLASLIVMPVVGKITDKFDSYKVFFVGSILTIIMVLVYTNLPLIPLWAVIITNMIVYSSIMVRMIPVSALNSILPNKEDRGAYMSIASTLQQVSGGLGALLGGMIVFQQTKTSPLEHFNKLGYVVVMFSILCMYLVSRVSVIVKTKAILSPVANNETKSKFK